VGYDQIFEAFLETQLEQGMALARASDLLELVPVDVPPHQRYVARYRCRGLVRRSDGDIAESDRFEVGIWFPDDYLRRVDPYQILWWLEPQNVWHPNISDKAPAICLGHLGPATSLVDLLYQVFEIITYHKYSTADSLNRGAAAWARQNQHRFPIDTRPLKRRVVTLDLSPVA